MFSVIAAPKLRPLDKNLKVNSGDSVGITCSATAGDPPIIFQWTRNGSSTNSLSGVNVVQLNMYSSTLGISQATSNHTGRNSCLATNSVGFSSTTLLLEVHGNKKRLQFVLIAAWLLILSLRYYFKVNFCQTPSLVYTKALFHCH